MTPEESTARYTPNRSFQVNIGIHQGFELGRTRRSGWRETVWPGFEIWNSPIPEEPRGSQSLLRCSLAGAGDRRQSDNVCEF